MTIPKTTELSIWNQPALAIEFPSGHWKSWVFPTLWLQNWKLVSRFSHHVVGIIHSPVDLETWDVSLLTKVCVFKDVKWQIFRLLPSHKTPALPYITAWIWMFSLYTIFICCWQKNCWPLRQLKWETNGEEHKKNKFYLGNCLKYAGLMVNSK